MMNHSQAIYLDEAGHTGGNLLDLAQPVFVYAAVAMDEAQATAIHSEAVARFRINDAELKGGNLVRRQRGRDAATWILEQTVQCSRAVVIDKEYALAGKFFEYVLEPVLAERNSLFYGIGLHKFVAMVVYLHFRTRDEHADRMLANFQHMMRTTDAGLLEAVLSGDGFHFEASDPLTHILNFALCHQERIKSEIRTLETLGNVLGWALELSSTAAHWLLASWGEEFDALRVYCDNSKSVAADLEFFENFIGRKDKVYIRFGQTNSPSLVYNLAQPIQLVNSRQFAGVQIADVWASALAYSFNHGDNEVAKNWLDIAENVISNTIMPDTELVNVDRKSPFINWVVLMELCDRSIKGEPLLQDMDLFILTAQSELSDPVGDFGD